MSRGSPTRGQTTQGKDGKPVNPNESEESACFGSSVHYGGRDFSVSPPSDRISGAPKSVSKTANYEIRKAVIMSNYYKEFNFVLHAIQC